MDRYDFLCDAVPGRFLALGFACGDVYPSALPHKHKLINKQMKGQSEIAYLPKFVNMMLIVMVIVITEILYIILNFDCFENQ